MNLKAEADLEATPKAITPRIREKHFFQNMHGDRVYQFWKLWREKKPSTGCVGCAEFVGLQSSDTAMCRQFSIAKPAWEKEFCRQKAISNKSEGGAGEEIDTSIDCMSLTNSQTMCHYHLCLRLMIYSRNHRANNKKNFYNEP